MNAIRAKLSRRAEQYFLIQVLEVGVSTKMIFFGHSLPVMPPVPNCKRSWYLNDKSVTGSVNAFESKFVILNEGMCESRSWTHRS